MNEYNEFCRAWKLAFPGQDLPSVWEEDTRANLLRHQKNLEYLKSEVCKEEFYIKFLEGVLSNAENRKQQASPTEIQTSDSVTEASCSATCRPPAELSSKPDFVTVISIANKFENSQEHAKQVIDRPKAPPKPIKQYSRSVSSDSPSKSRPEDLIAWTKQQIQQLQTKQPHKHGESSTDSPPLVGGKCNFESVADLASKRRISYENVKPPTSNYENVVGFSIRCVVSIKTIQKLNL